jgi:hypothetical protein
VNDTTRKQAIAIAAAIFAARKEHSCLESRLLLKRNDTVR